MSSVTPGTKIDTTSRFSSRIAVTAMILGLVIVAVVLTLAIRDRRAQAAYEDAFATGGVDGVVAHANERGDDLSQFTGGAYTNGGHCYLVDGTDFTDETLATCQEAAGVAAALAGS